MSDYFGTPAATEDFLAHYGVKGMRWGVRKARYDGNERALERHYRKAMKKLAKLEERGNNGRKYAKRATLLGAGAALTGGIAAGGSLSPIRNAAIVSGKAIRGVGAGFQGAANAIDRFRPLGIRMPGVGGLRAAGKALYIAGNKTQHAIGNVSKGSSNAIEKWSNPWLNKRHEIPKETAAKIAQISEVIKTGDKVAGEKVRDAVLKNKKMASVSNRTLVRLGAAGIGTGLAGAAGYNAYRAATAKKNRARAAEMRQAIREEFAGTRFENAGPYVKRKKRRQ